MMKKGSAISDLLCNIVPQSFIGKTAFTELFFKRQLAELLGPKGVNWFFLCLILFLTFLAMGFSLGNYKILQQRMNDPFTNLLEVPKTRISAPLAKYFQKQSNQDQFEKKQYKPFRRYFRRFLNKEGRMVESITGRTLDTTDLVFERIQQEMLYRNVQNLDNSYQEGCGIIATKDFLQKLGYKPTDWVKKLVYAHDPSQDIYIVLDVVAVVNRLPNKADFSWSSHGYGVFMYDNLEREMLKTRGNNLISFVSGNNDIELLRTKIKSLLSEKQTDAIIEIEPLDFSNTHHGSHVKLRDGAFTVSSGRDTMMKRLVELDYLFYYSKLDCYRREPTTSITHFAFYFEPEMNKIIPFRDTLKTMSVEIDMSKIEAKENFKRVSSITFGSIVGLGIFALLSIYFFVKGMMQTHFSRVKKHLAALMANGISSSVITKTYLKIITVFVVFALIVSFVAAFLVALLYRMTTEEQFWNIHLHNIYIAFTAILALGIFLILSKKEINNYLSYPPGDVINSRI